MIFRAICLLIVLPALALAEPGDEPGTLCSSGRHGAVQCIRPSHFVYDTCQAIAYFAPRNGLDTGFLARLLWQESRFDPNALSHANARGIAQFIDSTAARRGLRDSHNPAEAIEHSAEYLGALTRRYGNMGLAAVAYNGGETRADGLVAKTGGLARETIDYVRIITGLSAETWRDSPPETHDFRLSGDQAFLPACYDLARNRRITPYPAPEPPTPAVSEWGVQLAYGMTEKAARNAFAAKSRACKREAGRHPLDIIYVANRVQARKGYYMARLGADSIRGANALCNTLRASGCVCTVYKNR